MSLALLIEWAIKSIVIVLIIVYSKPVCFKVSISSAQRQFLVNAGNDTLPTPCIISACKPVGQKGRLISIEQRIIRIKGGNRRTLPANEKEVTLSQLGLKRRDVDWLQQFYLHYLATPVLWPATPDF